MEPLNDEADVLAVLRALVQQIELDDYQCPGGPLKLNEAYLEAKALLELKSPTQKKPPPR